MIDISLYITKLDILREYMRLLIDGKMQITIDLNALPIPALSTDQIMGIYYETGVLFYNREDAGYPVMKPTSFEEYYNWKVNQK